MILEIELSLEGDKFCAMIGENLQEGNCGFGDTPREALHNLIDDIEIIFTE